MSVDGEACAAMDPDCRSKGLRKGKARHYRIVNQGPVRLAPPEGQKPPGCVLAKGGRRPAQAMESLDYLRFVAGLAVVVGLIAGVAWAARRFGLAPRIGAGGQGRLGIVAAQTIDNRRRLVLVRRDDREHLILIGPNSETVIETGIRAETKDAPQP